MMYMMDANVKMVIRFFGCVCACVIVTSDMSASASMV